MNRAPDEPLLEAHLPASIARRTGFMLAGLTLVGLTAAVMSRRAAASTTSTIRMAATGGRLRYGSEELMATKKHGRCAPLWLRRARTRAFSACVVFRYRAFFTRPQPRMHHPPLDA